MYERSLRHDINPGFVKCAAASKFCAGKAGQWVEVEVAESVADEPREPG